MKAVSSKKVHPGGFEPPTARFVKPSTLSSRSYGCIGKLHLLQILIPRKPYRARDGASGRIRTSGPSVRSRVLHPAELRMQMAVRRGFEPRMQLLTAYPLAGERLQPLGHLTTRLYECLKNLFCSSSLRGAHITFGTYKSNNFPELLSLAHFTLN